MKLAEALLLRADIQKKLASLRERIVANAVVQEKEKPHEDPNALMREACGAQDQLEKLVSKINETNLRSKLPDAERLSIPQLVKDLGSRGQSARETESIDDIVSTIVREHRLGDLVVLMSNGGFGGIHQTLLRALA